MSELIFLEPVLKEVIWGGNALRTKFGYDIPSETTGEAWVVSAHKNGDCRVRGGQFDGCTLSQLWNEHRELFGGQEGDQFPILIKIIDAKQDLSIQVHPDDAYAKVHENGSLGKTECWYILDCDPDASIVVGHNASSTEEMQQMIAEDRWDDLLCVRPIKKGDFFQIEPGTVHAIQYGTMILEIQQSSDITYRMYDYNRLQNGKLRPLHLEQCMDVIRCPHEDVEILRVLEVTADYELEELVDCPFYAVEHAVIHGELLRPGLPLYEMIDVIEGEGTINGTPIKKGDHFVIPHGYGDYTLQGNMEIMLSRP